MLVDQLVFPHRFTISPRMVAASDGNRMLPALVNIGRLSRNPPEVILRAFVCFSSDLRPQKIFSSLSPVLDFLKQ